MTFSRGLYPGWMHGVNHQELVGAYYGKKRGPYVGQVTRIIDDDTLELDELHIAMKPGDGVVFENLSQTRTTSRAAASMRCAAACLSFRHGLLRMEDVIQIGTRVFKTSDPALNRALRQSFEERHPDPQAAPARSPGHWQGGRAAARAVGRHHRLRRCRCRPR